MKRFVVYFLAAGLVFILTEATSCGGKNKTHNFIFGKREYRDKFVFMSNPKDEGSFLRKISKDVIYPQPGHNPEGLINYIEVIDQYKDGKGGCAYLTNGGVGQDHVSIHVKSGSRGGGFNFVIKIYTKMHDW